MIEGMTSGMVRGCKGSGRGAAFPDTMATPPSVPAAPGLPRTEERPGSPLRPGHPPPGAERPHPERPHRRRGDPAGESPVFLDQSGSRRRWFVALGMTGATVLAVAAAFLVASFVGGGPAGL